MKLSDVVPLMPAPSELESRETLKVFSRVATVLDMLYYLSRAAGLPSKMVSRRAKSIRKSWNRFRRAWLRLDDPPTKSLLHCVRQTRKDRFRLVETLDPISCEAMMPRSYLGELRSLASSVGMLIVPLSWIAENKRPSPEVWSSLKHIKSHLKGYLHYAMVPFAHLDLEKVLSDRRRPEVRYYVPTKISEALRAWGMRHTAIYSTELSDKREAVESLLRDITNVLLPEQAAINCGLYLAIPKHFGGPNCGHGFARLGICWGDEFSRSSLDALGIRPTEGDRWLEKSLDRWAEIPVKVPKSLPTEFEDRYKRPSPPRRPFLSYTDT